MATLSSGGTTSTITLYPWNGIRLKGLRISPYGIAALAIIVLATLLRLVLIAQGWPQTNSDEGTIGLMALHIAYRGELPVFFYGQGYMGPFEAYLGAGLFHLFGPSLFTLRLGLVLIYTCFLVSMYLLTSLLFTKKLALVSLVLLALGTGNMLTRQLTAIGGYTETLLFGSLIFLVASWLALSFRPDLAPERRWRRFMVYGCWGLLVGLGTWTDILVVPFALMAGLLLIRFCWSELRRWAGGYLLLGLILGAFPMIAYNVVVPFDTLAGLWYVHHTVNMAEPIRLPFFLQNILGTILVSIPIATGAYPFCSFSDLPLFGQGSPHTLQCTIFQGSWGLGYLALVTVGIVLAMRRVRNPSVGARFIAPLLGWRGAIMDGDKRIGHPLADQSAPTEFARLMLLGSAVLTVVLFILSPVSAQTPSGSARYLIGLLICTPAVIWPLWSGQNRFKLLLLFIGTIVLAGTLSTFSEIPIIQAGNQQQDALISNLLRLHATHIYSDYNTCNRLIFLTREQIICSVLDEHLQPGFDRYLPYRSIVRSDPRAAYVFREDSAQAIAFAQKIALSEASYQRFDFEGYVIYQPEQPP